MKWIQHEDVVASNGIHKTLVTNSADIQYVKWQHIAGIEKVFTFDDLFLHEKCKIL